MNIEDLNYNIGQTVFYLKTKQYNGETFYSISKTTIDGIIISLKSLEYSTECGKILREEEMFVLFDDASRYLLECIGKDF